jgi:hypothetical protein
VSSPIEAYTHHPLSPGIKQTCPVYYSIIIIEIQNLKPETKAV